MYAGTLLTHDHLHAHLTTAPPGPATRTSSALANAAPAPRARPSHASPPAPFRAEPNWLYLTPLIFAFLPLVRVVFRDRPVLRDRLFVGGAWGSVRW